MKKLIAAVLACGLLAGCVDPFTKITNPLSTTNLYEAELVFDASLKTFNTLKGLCANRVLPPACRTYVKKGQALIVRGYAADKAARAFVINNPSLDATNVVQAVTGIITDFKSTVDGLSALK